MVTTSALRRHLFSLLPVVLAVLSLMGLRGIAGFYVSPAVAFALGVAAVGAALRRSDDDDGRERTTMGEVALALAIAASGAAMVAILATGRM